LGGIGLAVLAVGLELLSQLAPHAGVADIVWRMAICGIGFGIFQSPNNRAMMSAAPRRRSGAAGGMLATARLTGQTAGAAGVALIFRIQGRESTNLTLIVAAIVAAVAACVSLTRLVGRGATPVPADPVPADA
jgi:DHA2 family multidrug resistance protein-like MFS transporter